jgi:hypothetical protein
MSPPLHQRLRNEATQHGTAEVLRQSPANLSRAAAVGLLIAIAGVGPSRTY